MSTILVPIDFSETAENALEYAIHLANYISADIKLLHVDSIPLVNNEFQDLSYAINKSREEYNELLKEKALQIKKSNILLGDVSYQAESGDLKTTIGIYISEKDIDLIVMGVTGHETALGKALFGSNAVSVSRESNVPVFITPKNYQFKPIKNIAYACEYDEAIKEHTGLIQIKNFASLFGAQVSVLHVIPDSHLINEKEAALDLFIEKKLEHVDHRTFILSNNSVSTALLNFIEAHDIDAIIIEQKKHSLFHKLIFPSATKDVAFKTPVPLVTIHG